MPSPPLPPRIALTEDVLPAPSRAWRHARRNREPIGEGGVPQNAGTSGGLLLAFVMVTLLAAVVVLAWQRDQVRREANHSARQAELAWAFGDGMLEDLNVARGEITKLDEERRKVISMLGQAEKLHAALRGELSLWQQKHDELAASAEQSASQWSAYGKTLQASLDATRAKLDQTSDTLRQERSDSHEQLSQLDDEKSAAQQRAAMLAGQKHAVEQQADALSRRVDNLDDDNNKLAADNQRLRNTVNGLVAERDAVELKNANLNEEIGRLHRHLRSLEDRIHSLEQDKPQERDKDKSGAGR